MIQRYMLNFHFSEKDLGLVSPPNFVYDFSRKMLLMLRSINWPSFIVCLVLLLKILGNMCIKIGYWPGCGITKFQINFIFLTKPFRYMTKKYIKNISWEQTKLLSWNKKHFSSFLKGFLLPKTVSDLKVRL